MSGLIRAGDGLIAVNSVSLQGVEFAGVVEALKVHHSLLSSHPLTSSPLPPLTHLHSLTQLLIEGGWIFPVSSTGQ
jgi:hypothetical protein